MDTFERLIETLPDDSRQSIRDVADTMYMMKTWFEEYRMNCTASDLIEVTKFILEREEALIKAGIKAGSR